MRCEEAVTREGVEPSTRDEELYITSMNKIQNGLTEGMLGLTRLKKLHNESRPESTFLRIIDKCRARATDTVTS
jgi:hypothetical protein